LTNEPLDHSWYTAIVKEISLMVPVALTPSLVDSAGNAFTRVRVKEEIVVHNDAVVQGLSEAHRMRDVCHWGALTVGTGLGNARFSNRVQQVA
jgi:hypothetical protein